MRRLLKWAGIALAAFVALIVVIAIVSPAEETDEPTATEQAAEEPAETEAEDSPPPPPGDEDTGRMSDGEYNLFTSLDDELLREGEQWTGEIQVCSRIGQTGDLAGFRECVREAWEGFEGAAGAASTNAEDTFDDVGKECLAALRRYRGAVNRMYSVSATANEIAQSLQLELFEQAFRPLPRSTRRYSNASAQARDACRPQ